MVGDAVVVTVNIDEISETTIRARRDQQRSAVSADAELDLLLSQDRAVGITLEVSVVTVVPATTGEDDVDLSIPRVDEFLHVEGRDQRLTLRRADDTIRGVNQGRVRLGDDLTTGRTLPQNGECRGQTFAARIRT